VYKIQNGSVNYYFVENHYYFDRGQLYGEWDDGERFAFFSMAVIEFILATGNIPDILHANDWQSALSVIYLKTKYAEKPELASIKTLFTIHNIEYQGKYDMAILGDVFALEKKHADIVEYNGCINLLKGAITLTDMVSTVSPNYANELKHDFFAFGLANIIREAEHKMCGVINGIDYNYFSPDLGGDIDFAYTRRGYKTGKAKNKKALQNEIGLKVDPSVPLAVMITRLTAGKGIDLVLHIAEELLCENIQLVILGTGEGAYEDAFMQLDAKYDNLKALIKFDRVLSKKMYAAADMFIMPSKSEPCGLAQMIACSYGTVPIVREVGGLYDSIIPYGKENSIGFTFKNYNAHELLFTLKNALNVYNSPEEWSSLTRRVIKADFSWDNSAQKYIAIYNNL
jgi:starch synthase